MDRNSNGWTNLLFGRSLPPPHPRLRLQGDWEGEEGMMATCPQCGGLYEDGNLPFAPNFAGASCTCYFYTTQGAGTGFQHIIPQGPMVTVTQSEINKLKSIIMNLEDQVANQKGMIGDMNREIVRLRTAMQASMICSTRHHSYFILTEALKVQTDERDTNSPSASSTSPKSSSAIPPTKEI